MESPEELAIRYFNSGYNCAEAVLKAVAETFGAPVDNPQRLATAFGGGVARQGYICGCLSGASIAVGLLAGRISPDDLDGKERVYAAVTRLSENFKARAGAVECHEISGLKFDLSTHHNVCCPLVGFAARSACKEIASLQNSKG